MVAQLIRLKALMTWNGIKRQTWVLVVTILGLLWGLSIVLSAFAAVVGIAASGHTQEAVIVLVLAGSLLIAGWILLPIVFASLDNTLDPRRFAPYTGPSRGLALGLIAATPVGLGGVFSTLFALLPTVAWLVGGQPVAAMAALLGAALGLAIAFTWARVSTTWLGARLNATSGRRDLVNVVATLLFLVVLAPMGLWIQQLTMSYDPAFLTRTAEVAGWTPIGAPWAMALAIGQGRWAVAAARFAIALATLALGFGLWRRVLPWAMAGRARSISRKAEEALGAGRHLVDPDRATRDRVRDAAPTSGNANANGGTAGHQRASSAQRWFGGVEKWQHLGLSAQAASLAQRTQIYWLTDPRLSTSLAGPVLFTVMAIAMTRIAANSSGSALFFMAFSPLMMGSIIGALTQYDSTAFWILVSSEIRGRDERLGRLAGSLAIMAPLFALSMVACAVFLQFGPMTILHLCAATLVIFAVSTGIALAVGARWVYPVQPPGISPLATKGTGDMASSMAIQMGEFFASMVAGAPALTLLGFSQWGSVPTWISLPVALVWSVGFLWGGVVIGGRLWDRHSVAVLTKIRSWPGHALRA